MGHLSAKSTYQKLYQRLDMMPVGASEHPTFYKILRLLFDDEEAGIAAKMPIRFSTLSAIQKRTGLSEAHLKKKLETMAQKGLLIDIEEVGKETYYVLLPTVIGFFEFSMMRFRDDFDQKLLSKFYDEYMLGDPQNFFLKQALAGETQLVRTLVHEDTLKPEIYSEVLDYEKATELIKNAEQCGVSICHCRHVKMHANQACEHPLRTCLTLGSGSDYLIRRKLAEPIEKAEALDIIANAREMGMVQLADNVKKSVGFICNCCKCSCTILEGFRRLQFDEKRMFTSNYFPHLNNEKCLFCGKCVRACPLDCISITNEAGSDGPKKVVIDENVCIGCGVCATMCRQQALEMAPRPQRVFTPRHSIERILLMALERGKFQNLLFDNIESISIMSLNHILGWILKQESVKNFLLKENIRSRWVDFALNQLK